MGWAGPGAAGTAELDLAGKGTGGRVSLGAGGDRPASYRRDRLALSHCGFVAVRARAWKCARPRDRSGWVCARV